MAYCRITACPAERMKRSRSGHIGSDGSYFMTLVHNTWASGARAIAVPGWPELARCGASMARPRMTLMPSCSRSVVIGATLRGIAEEQHRGGEAVEEVAA